MGVDMLEKLLTHTRLPELPDVIGDILHGLRTIRHGLEEVADTVEHSHKILTIHLCFVLSCIHVLPQTAFSPAQGRPFACYFYSAVSDFA